ncbi:hypothetical protein RsoM2USA_55 [Ralstonia phage RsoM2USA]|nr:hypothetical protein RsoM2USA_55 [Ralstonia phage RsoM2USA]
MTTDTQPQSKGFLSKLKDAVWVSAPDATPPTPEPTKVNIPAVAPEPGTVDPAAVANAVTDLAAQVDKNPLAEGLAKFMTTLTSLESVIADETMRFKAALAACGISKDELTRQAGLMHDIFDKYEQNFIETKTNPAKEATRNLIDQANQTTAQIEELQNQLDSAKASLADTNSKMQQIEDELNHDVAVFHEAVRSVQSRGETLIKKIEVFLG